MNQLGEVLRPEIRPRADWGASLPVNGDLKPEAEVKFLLVHHSASSNDYTADEVPTVISDFYRFHTGPDKGWPHVAYNFFVDRFGTIWEARAGSIEGAVAGDATGGSQGFAQLCCLIGDQQSAPATEPQLKSLYQLLT